MLIKELLDELGYTDSPFFLKKGTRAFATASSIGHILRAASKPKSECGLLGVYTLANIDQPESAPAPLVYVCKAKDEEDADNVHRLVWNQDISPFLIVYTPKGIKFYSGFEYSGNGSGHLSQLLAFNEAVKIAKGFHADEINSGRFWRRWSNKIDPKFRVNWKLLANLRNLDAYLQNKCDVSRPTSHALIGKYVYLHYLRDRGILSDRKLASWDVEESQVFGGNASASKFKLVVKELEHWLNGNIFPIPSGKDAPKADHIKLVSGIFNGDDILPSGDRQLSLDFKAYDFSYIPIETLSVVYEQFLHTPNDSGQSKGKDEGAYYTPIPVVNYMLGEMEEKFPLEDGVRVVDFSCGSGAFLVQCYRRLIEKTYPQHKHATVHPIPLRELLVNNIFGLDRDDDACAVTELSLLMTLLDYVSPPDLEDDKRVKLPTLRGKNIFHGDFFDPLPSGLENKTFDWIVGNPPWKKLSPQKLKTNDKLAWSWMQENKSERPVGGNELARAFAWRVADYGSDTCEIALFLPAMTLFDKRAVDFRQRFFAYMNLQSVANFSNLAEVISDGRFRVPSASFFYSPRSDEDSDVGDEFVKVFSPLVANQEVTRPEDKGERIESWCITITQSEIRDVPYSDIINGSGLPWKVATWGSHNDVRLLRKLDRRFPALGDLQGDEVVTISQGPDLRNTEVKGGEDKTEYQEELVGKNELNTMALARLRHLFVFPDSALRPCKKFHLRLRAGRRTVTVCRGPHVIVSAARTFAIYEDGYLVIPSRQIGIISPNGNRDFLKALSLFLSSDFAFYHQFFVSSQFGVQMGRATLDALKKMPCPLANLNKTELKPWIKLHSQLIKTTPRKVGESKDGTKSLFPDDDNLDELLDELNDLVSESLGISHRDRALISDFMNVRLELNDGKVGRPAIRSPKVTEMKQYAKRLRDELDHYMGAESGYRHSVDTIYDSATGMICVDFFTAKKTAAVSVVAADRETAAELSAAREALHQEIGQWIYFDRDLRIHAGTKTYLFKPMQLFHWTESQAMIDANEIIAETVAATEGVAN